MRFFTEIGGVNPFKRIVPEIKEEEPVIVEPEVEEKPAEEGEKDEEAKEEEEIEET